MDYIEQIHDKEEYVLGEIYRIFHKESNMSYIGQTVSHRLNHGRYRPYGYLRRFKSHISEALCNTKKQQCSGIANALRKDGANAFDVELLIRCHKDQLNDLEKRYIEEYDAIYPSGYNLALGGNHKYKAVEANVEHETTFVHAPALRNAPRDRSTIDKIVTAVKKFREENKEYMEEKFKELKHKRDNKKLALLENVELQVPLDQYIRKRNVKERAFARIKIGDICISFDSQYDTYEESYNRAINLLNQAWMKQNTDATPPN